MSSGVASMVSIEDCYSNSILKQQQQQQPKTTKTKNQKPVNHFYLEYLWKRNTWTKHLLSYLSLVWTYVELEFLEHAAAWVWKGCKSPGATSSAMSSTGAASTQQGAAENLSIPPATLGDPAAHSCC